MVFIIESLWRFGILSVIIVFSVKIGLAMGFANLKKSYAFILTLTTGFSIIGLSIICQPYIDIIYQIVSQYSNILFGIMSVIIFYAGFDTIKQWKQNHKDHSSATSLAMVVPCPCCVAAVIGSIIVVSPIIGISAAIVGSYSGILLMVLIVIFYFLSEKIVKVIKKPYSVVLGNFMMFVGLYFIIAMIILPNIGTAFSQETHPITINSPLSILIMVLIMSLIIGISVFVNNRKYSNSLINKENKNGDNSW